jgi:hypothetical protein
MPHNCTTNGCEVYDVGYDIHGWHICDGCGRDDIEARRWVVEHPVWGWWHTHSCMPPDDWAGPKGDK